MGRRFKKRSFMRRARRAISRRRVYRKRSRLSSASVFHAKFRTQLSATVHNIVSGLGVPQDAYAEITFSADQAPHIQSYARIFNQYKIRKIKIEFIPTHNRDVAEQRTQPPAPGVQVVQDTNAPTFVTWVRRAGDSVQFPQSLNQALSISYAKQTNAGKAHKHVFVPSVLSETYRAPPALANAYTPVKARWIALSNTDVPHYGIRYFMSQGGQSVPDSAYEYRIVQTMYMSFRGRKADYTV